MLQTRRTFDTGDFTATQLNLNIQQQLLTSGSWTLAMIFKTPENLKSAIFSSLDADVTQSSNKEVVIFSSKSWFQFKSNPQLVSQALVENLNWNDQLGYCKYYT